MPAMAQSQGQTCEGSCGTYSPTGCWCDEACTQYGDCCPDKVEVCDTGGSGYWDEVIPAGTCFGGCGANAAGGGCWCDDACTGYGDCCEDVEVMCDIDADAPNVPPGVDDAVSAEEEDFYPTPEEQEETFFADYAAKCGTVAGSKWVRDEQSIIESWAKAADGTPEFYQLFQHSATRVHWYVRYRCINPDGSEAFGAVKELLPWVDNPNHGTPVGGPGMVWQQDIVRGWCDDCHKHSDSAAGCECLTDYSLTDYGQYGHVCNDDTLLQEYSFVLGDGCKAQQLWQCGDGSLNANYDGYP